ncbi:Rrf2 family transcriptional regulator [Synechococcus sp. CBW1004]|uniref:RrF2 family transcriptional regulator n=1 Tax=Synechococcus sp. CBW1004 TaxID=1353136 RepID=UPI0018CE8544|nr:Rrf2 family transcriptional regulator [Synechococcus sp. CBW1004]QPN64441.1 Rrf2 family transcriptional regulator [Synechococcus sp. CBW1004]
MALSAKVRYGIVALIELAAIHAQGGVLQVGEIAQRQSIPDRYLEQMLTTLRRARILRSIRGPKGGFQLARPPAEVPLLEVVAALEGESPARDLTARTTPEFEVLTTLEDQLERARTALLAGTTLQDLLEERDQRLQAQVMYFI